MPCLNSNLSKAKSSKYDEFYTQYEDIEKELSHYSDQLKNKIVYCNCDNPINSNFWKYFHINFSKLSLKKLIASFYSVDDIPYILEYSGKNNDNDVSSGKKILLKENGDFRSEECLSLLKNSDVVVTNPPFSLFKDFVSLLIENNKKFIVLGNLNAVTYKEIFPLLRDNKLCLGHNYGNFYFRVPKDSEPKKIRFFIDENGVKWRSLGNICWFTNLDVRNKSNIVSLTKNYNPDDYPKYDNYNAINVNKVQDIPVDYEGAMGVPITFIDKYNPDQFKILGVSCSNDKSDITESLRTDSHNRNDPILNGKHIYKRIFIKRIN